MGKRGSRFAAHAGKVNIVRLSPPPGIYKKGLATYVCDEEGCSWTSVCSRATANRHARGHLTSSKTGCHVYLRLTAEELVARAAKKANKKSEQSRERKQKYRQHKEAQEQGAGGQGRVGAAGAVAVRQTQGVLLFPTEIIEAVPRPPTSKHGGSPEATGQQQHSANPEEQQQREAAVVVRRGRLNGFTCHVHRFPGGGLQVLGNLAADSLEAVHVAITWANACIMDLTQWLYQDLQELGSSAVVQQRGGGARRGCKRSLWRESERLVLYVTKPSLAKVGGSLGVAAALSLVCLACGREARQDVAITGAMDVRGNVLDVDGLEGKLRACKEANVRYLLAPASTVSVCDEARDLPADLREYKRQALRPYRSLVEAIQRIIRGCPPGPERPLRVHLGVGRSLSYFKRADGKSAALIVEVGSGCGRWAAGHVEVTGAGAETMRNQVAMAHSWLVVQQQSIRRVLGMEPGAAGSDWVRRDLHVHLAQGSWDGMDVTSYTAVLSVAMVSFFLGGRPMTPGVAVFGSLTPGDMLLDTGAVLSSVDHVTMAQEQGLRWLVMPGEVVEDGAIGEAMRAAGIKVVPAPPTSQHPSNRFKSLVAALPLLFGAEEGGEEGQFMVE